MGGEIFLPVTARRIGRKTLFGFAPVASFNPYWDVAGKTYEDPDGYRVVLQNAGWPTVTS